MIGFCTLSRLRFVLTVAFLMISPTWQSIGNCSKPPVSGRVLFLGDSITYAGEYVNMIETACRMKYADTSFNMVNLGLPSETVSGLSEPGHAGGAFPRPDLHERLVRVLDQVKPEVVVACYGMNDGIYYPFSEDRFQAYQNGIKKLLKEVEHRKIRIVLLTPAFFDSLPIKDRLLPAGRDAYPQPYVGYDDVLQMYSEWLIGLRSESVSVIDTHSAMKERVLAQRKSEPTFTFATDGVHPNSNGHRTIAEAIAKKWDLELGTPTDGSFPLRQQVLKLVSERQLLLKHAWLSATKHTRPGIEPGLPMEQATQRALEIEEKISQLLAKP